MKRLVLLVPLGMLAAFLFTISAAAPSAACDCATPTSLAEKADAADTIVRAAAVDSDVQYSRPERYSVELNVTRVYRGESGRVLRFTTAHDAMCGLGGRLQTGRELVWFLRLHRGELSASGCNPPVSGQGVERVLGPGRPVDEPVTRGESAEDSSQPEGRTVEDDSSRPAWLVGGAGLAVIAAIAVLVGRRVRRA